MEPKKRILHIIQSLGSGGCENMLLRTLPLLTDFEHCILTLKEPGSLASLFEEKGISVQCVNQKGFFDLPSYSRISQELHSFRPDIVLTYLFHADMIGRFFVQRKTTAPIIPFLRTTYNHSRYVLVRYLEWLTKPLVKKYLANSEAVKDFYVQHIGVKTERITVIPNGIDTAFFDRLQPKESLQQELGIEPHNKVIICVANFHPNKGHQYLLGAFENVYQEFPNAVLLLVGNGEERESLKKQIVPYVSKKAIHFLGKRKDVPDLLKISDIFVLPTLFEGMSNALLEAMAAGLAIVTTDIPENKVLLKNENDALLVPPSHSEELQKALKDLLKDEVRRNALGEHSRKRIEKDFSLRHTAKLFSKVLDLVI